MEQEKWYILRTFDEQEREAAALVRHVLPKSICSLCRIPQKLKVFRVAGELRLMEDIMFPGYLFVKTACPEKLQKELKKSREFFLLIRTNGEKMNCLRWENRILHFYRRFVG